MLRLVGRSVLVQRETRRVLHGLRQSSGAVEMEVSIEGSCPHVNCVLITPCFVLNSGNY